MRRSLHKKCVYLVAALAVVLTASTSWSGEVRGKVGAVLRDTLVINLDGDTLPNVGDEVRISDSSPNGFPVFVGTWEVSKVKTGSVIAKKVEADGEAEVAKGMLAVIYTDNAAPGSYVQPEEPPQHQTYPPPDEIEVPVEMPETVAPVTERSQGGGLGAEVQNITQDLRTFFNIPSEAQGVLVKSVKDGSAAQRAGLETGDVITAFNGKKVADPSSLVSMVSALPPGTQVNVNVLRKGWEKDFSVILDGASGAEDLSKVQGPPKAEVPPEAETFYQKGKDFADKKEYGPGVYWLKKAADMGHAQGQNYLALMYLNGFSVERDYSVAAELFKKAVQNGVVIGNFNLGRIYENGWGVAADDNKAMEYYNAFGDYVEEYKKGARNGNQEAQNWLKKHKISWEVPQVEPQRQVQSQPQRGGYQQQMQQEQRQKNSQAAGELLPALMELRNNMIEGMNK